LRAVGRMLELTPGKRQTRLAMSQVPQPPQPPRIPPVTPPKMPRPPGAPPGVGKLGGLFKRRKKDEEFIADDSAEDAPAPAADGSDAAAATPATADAPPEPAPPPPVSYETWKWPSIEPKQEKGKAPMIALVVIVLLVLAGAGFGAYKLLHKDKKATPGKTTTAAATTVAKKPPPPPPPKGEGAFATSIESILAQSVAQRGKLVQVLAATENGCSNPVAQAKEQVAAVAAGRESLLTKTKALPAPTPQAKKIKGLLARALASSLAANRHYTAWVGGLAGASPCPGPTASNEEFKAAGAASVQASAAKQAFTKAFNPLARRLGQKTWSADAI
jgi:hypothetical protein